MATLIIWADVPASFHSLISERSIGHVQELEENHKHGVTLVVTTSMGKIGVTVIMEELVEQITQREH